MLKVKKLIKGREIVLIGLLIMIAIICINPTLSINACYNGIIVWGQKLLPALLPFFFITRLFAELGGVQIIAKVLSPITKKLFNTQGSSGYVYAMSVLSGYPVGAKLLADLYESGKLSRGQVYRTSTFTSTSGPLFVIGTVGVGMFGNKTLGLYVMLCHAIGALLNGLLYRNYKKDDNYMLEYTSTTSHSNILETCMLSSIKSILVVGGYVCFFFVVIQMLDSYQIFYPFAQVLSKITPLSFSTCEGIFAGVVEITKGCLDISLCSLPFKTALVILSGIISFGGISINLQALTFLKRIKFSTKFYFLSKITQTIITILVALLFCCII